MLETTAAPTPSTAPDDKADASLLLFAARYPAPAGAGLAEIWERLPAEEKLAALLALPFYGRACALAGLTPLDPETWLRWKMWRGFHDPAKDRKPLP